MRTDGAGDASASPHGSPQVTVRRAERLRRDLRGSSPGGIVSGQRMMCGSGVRGFSSIRRWDVRG